ncbi:peptidoglycan D,D-transpeptidase FtsI family protein [Planctomicrobium sp. SH664]|uniref:peptidoglycan D,D-transpeptidase FtsI family protein n=1 Tax=Planctomicrobium sp. SH664 TaxID=3448125 RepID=UPI003F5B2C88
MRNQPFAQFEDSPQIGEAAIDPRKRLLLLTFFVLSCFAVIGLRVAHIQYAIADRFLRPWREFRFEEEVTSVRDGRILSRDGIVLAQDETRYDVRVDYRWLETPPDRGWLKKQIWQRLSREARRDPARRAEVEEELAAERERLIQQLAEISGLSAEEITARAADVQKRVEAMVQAVEKNRADRKAARQSSNFDWSSGLTGLARLFRDELMTPPDRIYDDPVVLREELQSHVLLRNVPFDVVAAIHSQPAKFPGVHVESASTRAYPQSSLAAHVIGVRKTPPHQTSGEALRNRIAESGVERSHDRLLRGTPGVKVHREDRRGNRIDSEDRSQPRDGQDVTLTIDSRLQRTAEQLLDQALSPPDPGQPVPLGACLIAIDVWSGDVLTMATAPRPELPIIVRPTTEQWQRLLNDPRRPLFPRATQMALPAGSLFTLITAVAALESGVLTPDDVISCRGYLDRPDQHRCAIFPLTGYGHGPLRMDEALGSSCNVFFFEAARRMGPQPISDWASRFGFGQKTGIDLPGESGGNLPNPTATASERTLSAGSALQLAIGQGALSVTPLQVVRMMAALANGGYLVTPRVTVETTEDAAAPRFQKIEGLHPSTLTTIRRGLENVVHSQRGSGRSAQVEMLRMAGKTATVQAADRPTHAWMAGFAPADAPRIAFVVVLEHGGEGDLAAAPIVREFVTEMLGYGALRPPVDLRDSAAPGRPPVDSQPQSEDTSPVIESVDASTFRPLPVVLGDT